MSPLSRRSLGWARGFKVNSLRKHNALFRKRKTEITAAAATGCGKGSFVDQKQKPAVAVGNVSRRTDETLRGVYLGRVDGFTLLPNVFFPENLQRYPASSGLFLHVQNGWKTTGGRHFRLDLARTPMPFSVFYCDPGGILRRTMSLGGEPTQCFHSKPAYNRYAKLG